MVHHQFSNNLQTKTVGLFKKLPEIFHRTVIGIDAHVVGNIVSVITERRRIKGQQPYSRYAKTLEIAKLLAQSLKISYTIIVAVIKRLDMRLVNNCVFVPERFGLIHVEFVKGIKSKYVKK